MGFSGLSIATSGLRVAHLNLGITGHNMSNAEIRGFSRQRIVQHEAMTTDKGVAMNGDRMIIGMGTDRQAVQQLRNEFLDFTYRTQVGRLSFYSTIVSAGREIENMLGELYGAYNFQSVVNDMWFAIQELTRHPDGFATRQLLLSTANSFLSKSREVYAGLVEEQHNLNHQIIQTVNDINSLISQIHDLNIRINAGEMSGDNANDFRDQRNLALDQLAELIPLETKVNSRGEVNIMSMGHELLANGTKSLMGLRYISADFNFVIPVLGTGGQTISADTSPDNFISFMHLRPMDFANQNDFGKLHGLLLARGMAPAHHMSDQVPSPAERLAALGHDLVQVLGSIDWAGTVDLITLGDEFPSDHPLRVVFEAAGANPSNPLLLHDFLTAVDDFLNDPFNSDPLNFDEYDQYNALRDAITDLGADTWEQIQTAYNRFNNNNFDEDQFQNQIDYILENFDALTFNHEFHLWSIQHGMIPRVQQNLDGIVYKMVSMLNDAITGQLREVNPSFVLGGPNNPPPDHPNYALLDGGRYRFVFPRIDPDDPDNPTHDFLVPWNLNGEQRNDVPLFVRRIGVGPTSANDSTLTYHGAGLVDPFDLNSIFTIQNLVINPALLQPGGHNLLAISLGRDEVNDTRVLEALQRVWRLSDGPYTVEIGGREFRVQDAYIRLVGQISTDVNEAIRFTEAQRIQVIQADNRRQAIMGVSMDEELTAMLRFQYAFQAASRVINVIDSMIETVVNIRR
jgi:flagellar hook-associated protein FlgK